MSKLILVLCLVFAAISLPAAPQDSDCWGSDKPCADGKYRDGSGKEQPASCNNNAENTHKCECAIAITDGEHCPPGGIMRNYQGMGPKCQVSCREQACKCVNQCDT